MFEPVRSRLSMAGRLGILWCNVMHDTPTWPIHGSYQCRTCGRSYLVPWAAGEAPEQRPLIEVSRVTRGVLIQ